MRETLHSFDGSLFLRMSAKRRRFKKKKGYVLRSLGKLMRGGEFEYSLLRCVSTVAFRKQVSYLKAT